MTMRRTHERVRKTTSTTCDHCAPHACGAPKPEETVPTLQLHSTITCPKCGAETRDRMPIDACQFFWECPACGALLKPNPGDCCVFCSWGDVPCPPVQAGRNGCG